MAFGCQRHILGEVGTSLPHAIDPTQGTAPPVLPLVLMFCSPCPPCASRLWGRMRAAPHLLSPPAVPRGLRPAGCQSLPPPGTSSPPGSPLLAASSQGTPPSSWQGICSSAPFGALWGPHHHPEPLPLLSPSPGASQEGGCVRGCLTPHSCGEYPADPTGRAPQVWGRGAPTLRGFEREEAPQRVPEPGLCAGLFSSDPGAQSPQRSAELSTPQIPPGMRLELFVYFALFAALFISLFGRCGSSGRAMGGAGACGKQEIARQKL